MIKLCNKYVVLLEVLYRDKELKQWCRDYSAYNQNMIHCEIKNVIYDSFMKESYALTVLWWEPRNPYQFKSALTGTAEDLIYGICVEIRMDYPANGSLIYDAIASGRLYRLIQSLLSCAAKPQYTLDYIMAREGFPKKNIPGAFHARHASSMGKWHLRIQLDSEQLWYLSVFVRDDGSFENTHWIKKQLMIRTMNLPKNR